MIHRVGRRNFKHYAFDIESHNDEESIAKKETSMWLGCIIDENSDVRDEQSYFYSMDECIDFWEKESTPARKNKEKKKPCKNVCNWVYNLSFEWSFLLPVLLKRGFKFKSKINDDDEFCFNSITTKSVSSVWQIEIKFHKESGKVIFKDLNKIFAGCGSLRNLAKSFHLPTQKGDIDYRKNRLHNYVVTDEEREYCFKDCRIIVDILLEMEKREDNDFWNVTSAATYSMKKLLKTGFPRATRPYREFRKRYPILSKEENEFVRKSVEGGLTYPMPNFQFKDLDCKILHIDAHQMHPTQCYRHLFPYGQGTYFKGKPPKRFSEIACVRIRISYLYANAWSNIRLIGLTTVENFEITVWDFEIPTMRKIYEGLEIEYIDGYSYKCSYFPWRNYYADNYRKRLKAKNEKDAFGILYYKLLNNSSYGKFLEKPHNKIFENIVRDDGCIDSLIWDKPEEEISAKYTYCPAGSCIPAYSRVELIETALKFKIENLIYFDTDSIFCVYNDFTKKVWEEKIDHTDFLGGWGLEEISDRAQFTAPKRYKLLTEDGKSIIKAAGINFDKEYSYEEVNIVSSSWMVQRAYRVKGGTIIEFQKKEMKIQPKYEEIYKTNI